MNRFINNHLYCSLFRKEIHCEFSYIEFPAEVLLKDSFYKLTRIVLSFFILSLFAFDGNAKEFYTGASTVDITPSLPVALDGQMQLRIARTAETPLEANVLVLESREGDRSVESVIFVSCDLVTIPAEMLSIVKNEVHKILPELNLNNIVINATHTHTAPVIRKGLYPIPEKEVTQIENYYAFFAKKVGEAIYIAWKNRSAGSITWGLSHAKVGYNRRAVYSDGSAQMYGKTNLPEFRNIEGYEDQNINSLFCWDKNNKLIAMSIDVACTAQEVEGRSAVNADYWHPVRIALRKHFGTGLTVISWISAAGDQSPHLLFGSAGENRMLKLRNIDRMDEIARRIVSAIYDAYDVVINDPHKNITLSHKYEKVMLPVRIVTDAEFENSKKEVETIKKQIEADPKSEERLFRRVNWEGDVIKRYEYQKKNPNPMHEVEIHIVRIGDVVVCTNPFELFTDYGIAIQARSKAVQTFVVQLTGPGTYLPTGKALTGGGYSAIVESTIVGPEGGQILVDRTVDLISELWKY